MEERCGRRMLRDPNKEIDAQAEGVRMEGDRLQKALTERERFLERHPHLRTYQAEIDRILDMSGNSQGRLAVLGMLMQGKLLELQKRLYSLTEVLYENINSN